MHYICENHVSFLLILECNFLHQSLLVLKTYIPCASQYFPMFKVQLSISRLLDRKTMSTPYVHTEKSIFLNIFFLKLFSRSFDHSSTEGLKALVDCPLKENFFSGFPKGRRKRITQCRGGGTTPALQIIFYFFRKIRLKRGSEKLCRIFIFLFCRVKNCSYTNLVILGKSSTHHGYNCPDFGYRVTIFLH